MNTKQINAMVNERLEREPVGEVLNRSTVDDGHGNFITTIIFRTEPMTVRQGFDKPQSLIETRYKVFVNGEASSGGGANGEWQEVDEAGDMSTSDGLGA